RPGTAPALPHPVHGGAGHRHRERRPADHQERPRLQRDRPVLGDQRLHADVRRPAPAGRASGRSGRPAAHVHARPGALLGGLPRLVYALVQTVDHSWSAPRTIGLFAGSALLLAGFVAAEARAKAPLMPLHIFRNRSLSAANAVGLTLGASVFSMFFLLTLYMQQVLAYSPIKTGIGYLLVATVIIVSAGVSQVFVTRIGVRTVLTT